MTAGTDGGAGLLILAPLGIEARALRRGAPSATVWRAGMGPRRATATANRLHALRRLDRPDRLDGPDRLGAGPTTVTALAVAGVAGGLVPDLRPGDLVVADTVLGVDGQAVGSRLAAAPVVAAALRRAGLRVRVGPVASTDQLLLGSAARAGLAATGALAVDMESAWLLEHGREVPTVVVRAVVDTPDRGLLSPATLRHGPRALAALAAAAAVLEVWAATVRPRTVVVAGPRAFCAGVHRAVEVVERAIERFGPPLYVRRQIVHNRHVVDGLESRGAVFVQELDEVPTGATVVFSAHGVSPAVRRQAAERHLRVIDATCPLVAKVHTEVRRFAGDGYPVVLIGHADHDETEGTLGEAPDIQLVQRPEDVAALRPSADGRMAYVTQTTLASDQTADVVAALRDRFPGLIGPHGADICYATQNRQDAVRSIAADVDVILVIGSRNSSNTARLAEVAARAGCPAQLLDDESELDLAWLRDAARVGLTAGASAPESLVTRVIDAVSGLGPTTVDYRSVRSETVSFSLPPEVR